LCLLSAYYLPELELIAGAVLREDPKVDDDSRMVTQQICLDDTVGTEVFEIADV
jgi:hypothetical protein